MNIFTRIKNLYNNNKLLIRKIGIILFLATGMAACASSGTTYKVASEEGDYGYAERKLTDNRYRVSFTGNASTPIYTVQDYALLRAAELTIQKNYDWFEIADRVTTNPNEASSPVSSESSRFSVASRTPTQTRCGLLGCTTSQYPQAYSLEHRDFPGKRKRYTESLEVVMGSGDKDSSVYDAREVIESVRRESH